MLPAIFVILIPLLLSITVSCQDHLPQSDECGTLNTAYYYNQKNLTQIDEFPWMGRVLHKSKTEDKYWYKCYAILISKWFVLLNGKCLNFPEEPITVILGDWNKANLDTKSDCDDSGRCAPVPKRYKIAETIIHPNYSAESHFNDIALARLSEPVTYSEFIRPICLPSRDVGQINFDNQLLEVTGWFLNKSAEQILAKAFIRAVNFNTCELRLKNIYKIDKEINICAYSCWGDYVLSAGAALMGTTVVNEEPVNYYLIGIALFGQNKCVHRNPHVYSRVDRYLDWIYDNTNYESSLIEPRKANM